MADQAITALPKKTYSGSSQIASTDYLLGIDSAEGYQMLIQDLGEYIINRVTASLAGSTQTLASAISALNSNDMLTYSTSHTLIPNYSDFNNYTTPGVYCVMYDSDGATMVNAPRKSSGKLIVMARHTAAYLAQYFYPSTASFIRYVRSYGGGSWSAWITEEISYENTGRRQYSLGSISSSSTATFEELGLTKYQYGAYFVVLRTDSTLDGTWAGIVRHNSVGYQISEFYKGNHESSPYITTDGIIKNNSSAAVSCYGLVFPINVWGNLLS